MNIVNSWIGATEDELILSSWGKPKKTVNLTEKYKDMMYVDRWTSTSGGYYKDVPVTGSTSGRVYDYDGNSVNYSESTTNYVREYVPTETNYYICTTSFRVNKNTKIIEQVQAKGNNCTAYKQK